VVKWIVFRYLMRRNCGRVLGIAWCMYTDDYSRFWLAECLGRCLSQVEDNEALLMKK